MAENDQNSQRHLGRVATEREREDEMRKLLSMILLAVVTLTCGGGGGGSPTAPPAPTGPPPLNLTGTWNGAVRYTKVDGTGCVMDEIRAIRRTDFDATAEVTQTGEILEMTVDSESPLVFSLTGTIDETGYFEMFDSSPPIGPPIVCDGETYYQSVGQTTVAGNGTDNTIRAEYIESGTVYDETFPDRAPDDTFLARVTNYTVDGKIKFDR